MNGPLDQAGRSRRRFLAWLASALAWLPLASRAQSPAPPTAQPNRGRGGAAAGRGGGRGRGRGDSYELPAELSAFANLSLVLGRVSDRSVTVNALSQEAREFYLEYGPTDRPAAQKSAVQALGAGQPVEATLANLQPDTAYTYRVLSRRPGENSFTARSGGRFHTQRPPGSAFVFTIQGDSHPERPQMSHPELYARTLQRAAEAQPDFHICMGDDFSVEKLRTYSAEDLTGPYRLQRPFLGLVGGGAPLFLLNGNHEQASLYNYNLKGDPHLVAVGAQLARNRFFPNPAPDAFYSGDGEPLAEIGPLRDYCAWNWGDALFVILDNYWHSPALVDTALHERDDGNNAGKKNRDWWGLTLGDAQYQWFRRTLEQSKARYKFVFAHHVLGSGRGGIDEAHLYEWGGQNQRGVSEFKQRRPGWELPIHPLMVKHGVTAFFQGHDHLYVRQELDGIVYQEVPMPADHGYVAYNEDRYRSGEKLPNSGFLRVSVSPAEVRVDYVRTFLPQDENATRRTGDIAHSYVLKPKNRAT
jgi:hypothetical protein